MRVSLIGLNLLAEDATGACTINQARFFRNRGDDVHLYVLDPPRNVPPDVAAMTSTVRLSDLTGGDQSHFRLSDLYIFHYPGYYELLEMMQEIDRGTVVFYYHNVTPPDLWRARAGRESQQQGMSRKALVHYADLCITASPFNKQDLVEQVGFEPDRIHVLPLAVPLDRFTPGPKDLQLVRRYHLDGQNTLLFVGRMAGNKRIDLLVESLAQVKRHVLATKLLLVGDHDSSPALREITAEARAVAARLGITRDVIFTGRVDDLPRYLRLADLYVTASLHEGFGVPLIEAMACGIPVVAGRSGAMPWVLGEAGLLCEPDNAQDLAAKILTVLGNEDVRQQLIEQGRERVQAFSLERYEAGLAEIVDKAVTYTLPAFPLEPAGEAGQEKQAAVPQPWPGYRSKAGSRRARARDGGLPLALSLALRDVRAAAQVNPHLPIAWPSWPRGVWPKIAALAQKIVRRLLRWYINPIVEQQNQFNAAVVRALDELSEQLSQLEAEWQSRPLQTGPEGAEAEPAAACGAAEEAGEGRPEE